MDLSKYKKSGRWFRGDLQWFGTIYGLPATAVFHLSLEIVFDMAYRSLSTRVFRIAAGALLPVALVLLLAIAPAPGRISKVVLTMSTVTVEKGRKIKTDGQLFFQAGENRLVSHFTYPVEQVVISNRFGEVKLYDPKGNTVSVRQDHSFNTKGSLLYFFLASTTSDLGLRDMGFSLTNTKYDQQYMVSTWNVPPQLSQALSKIELVHEGYRPVYMVYFDVKGKPLRKMFFSEYETLLDVDFPKRVTEINYFEEGADSAITRIQYSNIMLNEQAQSDYFNFEIPDNAHVVE